MYVGRELKVRLPSQLLYDPTTKLQKGITFNQLSEAQARLQTLHNESNFKKQAIGSVRDNITLL